MSFLTSLDTLTAQLDKITMGRRELVLNGSGKNDASKKISMNENNNNQTKIGILRIKYFIPHLLDLVYQTKSSCANIYLVILGKNLWMLQ